MLQNLIYTCFRQYAQFFGVGSRCARRRGRKRVLAAGNGLGYWPRVVVKQ
jgi:hypothetical protein